MRRILGPMAAVGGAAAAVILMAGPALAAPSATVSPNTGLKNGDKVTVSVKGYPASQSGLLIVECNPTALKSPGAAHCDITNLGSMTIDASGNGTATFTVKTGTIGDGACNPGDTCAIAVSNASGDPTLTAGAPITFAGAPTAPSAAPTTGTSGGSTTTGGSTVTGGTSTSTGKPFGLEMGLGAALVLAGLGAGGYALRRRVSA